MTVWLDLARITAGVNVLLLLALGYVWVQGYRDHGAAHTLGLIVFASFLLVENALWLYFYVIHPSFIGWFLETGTDVQIGLNLLCGLELVALAFLAKLTWQ